MTFLTKLRKEGHSERVQKKKPLHILIHIMFQKLSSKLKKKTHKYMLGAFTEGIRKGMPKKTSIRNNFAFVQTVIFCTNALELYLFLFLCKFMHILT